MYQIQNVLSQLERKLISERTKAGMEAARRNYLCFKKECASYRKSIRRDALESEFAAFLQQLRPSEDLFGAFSKMLRMVWDHRLASSNEMKRSLKAELAKVERDVEQFLDRSKPAS